MVGGTTPEAANVISGNSGDGIFVGYAGTNQNLIQGNLIGLDATGSVAIPNGGTGVDIYLGPQGNMVGGGVAARNYLSGNSGSGVSISGTNSNGNFVQGNRIGCNVLGAPAPNGFAGVEIFNHAQNNFGGGATPGASNLVAENGVYGVALFDAATTGNAIQRNSLFHSGSAGIGLFSGANDQQNAPQLSSAQAGLTTTVAGTLNSTAGATFRVELFATSTADPAGSSV